MEIGAIVSLTSSIDGLCTSSEANLGSSSTRFFSAGDHMGIKLIPKQAHSVKSLLENIILTVWQPILSHVWFIVVSFRRLLCVMTEYLLITYVLRPWAKVWSLICSFNGGFLKLLYSSLCEFCSFYFRKYWCCLWHWSSSSSTDKFVSVQESSQPFSKKSLIIVSRIVS